MVARKLLFTVLFTLSSFVLFAQQGIIRGVIKDAALQEGLPFATVQVKGTTQGTVTDFEGGFNLKVDAGTYTIIVSFVGYVPQEITDVVVEGGGVTPLSTSLEEEAQMMEAIVVTAEQINNTESAILNVQRKSANLLDGISKQNFRKIGDSNVAGAVSRVPGVSVQGGKYVFVRGLGDRYTKTILNGIDIPGLDPDRNTVQMDIFPTNLIDNILVMKSSSADLPADFTGGVVNIITKEFPEESAWSVSASVAYNPDMHFNSNYLAYSGSSTDWLGYDNGLRDDPQVTPPVPFGVDEMGRPNSEIAREMTEQFTPNLTALRENSGANYSFGLTGGNQMNFSRFSLGYNLSLSYRNTTEYYEGFENGEFFKNEDVTNNGLRENRIQVGDLGSNNRLISSLLGLAVKTDRSKVSLNFLHLQNGESRAGFFEQEEFINQVNTLKKDNLEYSQRSLTNFMVAGKHTNQDASLEVEWKFAPTFSRIEDKDLRVTPFRTDGGTPTVEASEAGDPTRIWRNLEEVNYVGRLDVTKKFDLFAGGAKFKTGVYYTNKERDFDIPFYIYTRFTEEVTTGNPDDIHAFGYIRNTTDISNTFNAVQQNIAGYVSNEFKFNENLRSVVGLRVEKYDQWYTGEDQAFQNDPTVGRRFDNERILDMLDFFPSMNLIYGLTEQSNLRLSYSKTIARPSFKEVSVAQIADPVSGRTFIGNIDLDKTDINNFDLRWENFQGGGKMIALSAFFKTFDNPIEIVAFSDAAPEDLTPRNLAHAIVYGTELEARQDLEFLGLSNFFFNANLTFQVSRQEIDKSPGGEFDSRVDNARATEEIKDTRNLQGQSPYMINVGLNYDNINNGWQAGIFYNVQGRRLQVVGVGAAPDVFEMPFHSLNFNMNKTFGPRERHRVGFGINNILEDDRESRYQSWDGSKYVYLEENVYSKLSPGTRFTLRYAFSF